MRKSLLLLCMCLSFVMNCKTYAAVDVFKAFSDSKNQKKNNTEPETVVVNIIPHVKNALFDAKHPVKYNVEVFNNYKSDQEGKIAVEVKTATGGVVGISEIDFKVKANNRKMVEWKIPVDNPGFYDIIVRVNLTEYDDTIRNVFGYRPFEITTPLH